MGLSVELEDGRRAFVESVESFLRAVGRFSEHDLLGASRCHGWTRLDVVVHVIGGWQEMLGGMVSVVDDAPTVDAATYWPGFAEVYDDDPLSVLMAQRRRTAAYSRPASACEQLRDVGETVRRGAAGMTDRSFRWQGQVFTAGDFLAIWAVEDVVHHLDLLADEPAPAAALGLTRATVEALAGGFPPGWDDEGVTLVGTGRRPVPEGLGAVADRLPAFT